MFPNELKLAEDSPIFKKNDEKDKSSFRPISILSNISKIYERFIQTQLNEYFANFLSEYQWGFRQGFNTQHCILVITEKLRKIRDEMEVLLLFSLSCQNTSATSYTNFLSQNLVLMVLN